MSYGQRLPKRPQEEATRGTEPDPAREKVQSERIRNMPRNEWVKFENPGREAPVRTWGSCAFDTDEGNVANINCKQDIEIIKD